MMKRAIALTVIMLFLPGSALAFKSLDVKKVEDLQKDIAEKHKKEIKKELGGTKGGYNFDLSQNDFTSDTRFGLTNMTGNTRSLAINGTDYTMYRYRRFANTIDAGVFYSHVFSSTKNQSIGTSARYIYGNYRFDYFILPRLTWFAGAGGYSDELKGIDKAPQAFTGFKYYFLQAPTYFLSTSLGYNFTHEDRVAPNPNRNIHSAGFMLDYEHEVRDNLKVEQHVEVLEDAENGKEIRVNSDTSLKVYIAKHLGIALSFLIRFDNQPTPGYKKLDTISNVSLAVTF